MVYCNKWSQHTLYCVNVNIFQFIFWLILYFSVIFICSVFCIIYYTKHCTSSINNISLFQFSTRYYKIYCSYYSWENKSILVNIKLQHIGIWPNTFVRVSLYHPIFINIVKKRFECCGNSLVTYLSSVEKERLLLLTNFIFWQFTLSRIKVYN